ncbi:MAG: coenzyme F420-0:L-glutamate ligase [Halobacteriota archaeon]|nr:coenzyme F420-0:L-glutamate ligase [Halobacteriota archaeon]
MKVEIFGLEGIPEIREGDDLVGISIEGLKRTGLTLEDGDIIVITSKIVSKSEGRLVDLSSVEVTREASKLARETDKDERIAQLILDESMEIIKIKNNIIITESRDGMICANVGIDESNVDHDKAVLLPLSPQKSARSLRKGIEDKTGKRIALLLSDSIGRPFRDGIVGSCVGVSGLPPVVDRRGEVDRFGKVTRITKVGLADEICSAANLVMGEFTEGIPIVLVRGITFESCESEVSDMIFDRDSDLFR